MSLIVETFVTGPLDNNLYLLIDDAAREAVVVDPSIGCDAALQRVAELVSGGTRLAAIWNTHGHFDHIYDNHRWRTRFDVPLLMHRDDLIFIERLHDQAIWMGLPAPEAVTPDAWFTPGADLAVGSHSCRVLHTPGHSPGSVTFVFDAEDICIDGDVLFAGSVGRTDLPGCSAPELGRSLRLLLELPDATRVLPGHGPATTIGEERRTNPYCREFMRLTEEIELER